MLKTFAKRQARGDREDVGERFERRVLEHDAVHVRARAVEARRRASAAGSAGMNAAVRRDRDEVRKRAERDEGHPGDPEIADDGDEDRERRAT